MTRLSRALVVLVVATGGIAVPAVAATVTCPTVAPPALSFDAPVYIDPARAGGEPVSTVARDGAIVVSAHAGTTHVYKDPNAASGAPDFAVGYTNQTLNWRSTDPGHTHWTFIGVAGQDAGPHTATSTGFSDPDLTMDDGGRIYNTEIDLANISVFSSPDDGQSFPFGHPLVSSGDRPWLTGGHANEVWVTDAGNLGQEVWRSTDGGVTFSLQTSNAPLYGKMLRDPLDPTGESLIAPSGSDVAISTDAGVNWRIVQGPALGASTDFFRPLAVDKAGWVYAAAAGGYRGPGDTAPTGSVTFSYLDRASENWGDTVTLPTPQGDALWPWIVAGDDGRAAMVWLQTLASSPNDFYVYAAFTRNAHGTTVTCSDGTTRFVPPQFTVTNASGRPIHTGAICLQGTACNLKTGDAGDRRLGDFLTVNYDLQGRIFIASADTELANPLGGPKPVSNPLFMLQSMAAPGNGLLANAIAPESTPCVYLVQIC